MRPLRILVVACCSLLSGWMLGGSALLNGAENESRNPTVQDLQAAIAANPNDTAALFNLAVTFAIETPPDKENARKYYERALKAGVERDSSLEKLIDWNGPGAAPGGGPSSPAKTAAPSIPPELLPQARAGKEQFERGDYLEAEKTYREILVKAPNNLSALSNLGVVLFRTGKYRQAEESLKNAIAVAPEDSFSHCTLGIVYYSQGQYDEAINELTRTLTLDPKNAIAHKYLGVTCNQKGWYDAAQKELKTATELDPSLGDKTAPDEKGVPQGPGDFPTPSEKERLQSPAPVR